MINNSNNSIYEILKQRDMIKQIAFEDEFKNLVKDKKISLYLGIDPTADSLHIGHFIPLMMMSYFQKCGHRPIILVGGGTGFIGDPSGKTDMRKMLSKEEINKNIEAIKKQISKFLSFEGDNAAIILNNATWLLNLNYLEFLRNYGIYFNVNKMLAAECYRKRMEKGLTFFELNYMLMQSYDFLHLYETEGCKLEIGGDDQWSNMISGVELIRKIHKNDSFCITCPLLLNAEGKKMGKTVNGALWLDKNKTSVYDFYQYWRNIKDNEVYDVLRMLTYIPMDQVKKLSSLKDDKINEAKKIAAFEITKLIHGEKEAQKAQKAAEEIFVKSGSSENMPTAEIDQNDLNISSVLVESKLAPSKSQAKILIKQGGIVLNDKKITDENYVLTNSDFEKGYGIIRKGKKTFIKIVLKNINK